MMHFSNAWRSVAAATAASSAPSVRSVIATGLRSEFPPHWPLPLPPPMPRDTKKHTLVLDIDETLIHTYGMTARRPADDRKVASDEVPLVDYHVLLRPHLREFLEEVKDLFEVIFWTAGTASYCCAVLDAMEGQVLGLPRSFYHHEELAKELTVKRSSTAHVNFYALSRTQTLEAQAYMKYLPMLGRPMSGIIMLDDNVRSFPLTPRNGLWLPPFDPDDRVLQRYMWALGQAKQKKLEDLDANLVQWLRHGTDEMARLESDRSLLDILPVLRAAAKVPIGGDVTRELDYWRDPDYTRCDNFMETMNHRSVVRRDLLGKTLPSRSDTPIAPLKHQLMNSSFTESADAEMRLHHAHPAISKL